MGRPVGVRVPPSAPLQYSKGFRLSLEAPLFVKLARVADVRLAGLFFTAPREFDLERYIDGDQCGQVVPGG
jgi:hypothetical protein